MLWIVLVVANAHETMHSPTPISAKLHSLIHFIRRQASRLLPERHFLPTATLLV
jgi:hypothetical protein